MAEKGTWLTREAFDRLTAELEQLKGPGRTEIAQRIEDARSEGDLKENGGYHAAREEQAKQEARINHLTVLLRDAQVGEAPADDGVVEAGMVVDALIAGSEKHFLLGSREASKGIDIEVYSESSPLGQAIVGHQVGDTVAYTAPNGAQISVEIRDAKPFES